MHKPNRLINETSPYLLQHAYNPVEWYPWGEDALAKAKEQNKPLLVSIGYSACHWCHVMERESFENEDIAAIMNEHFINIKIDREERPDLDHFFMDALHLMSGSGGWPLNIFITPEGMPFYGGTYFAPQPAYNRPSWPQVLFSIHQSWQQRRTEIEEQAKELVKHLQKGSNFSKPLQVISLPGMQSLSKSKAAVLANTLLQNSDKMYGGLGRAPKFLQTFSIQYLLQNFYYTQNNEALEQAELSLSKMIDGGIYDQLGGGIARYSTDAKWLAPHFEKMLYDNALFAWVLSDAYLLTNNPKYLSALTGTINFLLTEMKSAEGGYYAAIDADSEGVEGKFYTWAIEEINNLLGKNAGLFCQYYNITEQGNWEETNILHTTSSLAAIAKQNNLSLEEAKLIVEKSKAILLAERNKRVRPGTDDKIILGWNALLVSAFCKAYSATFNSDYLNEAKNLCGFIERHFKVNEMQYFHTYKNGEAKHPAFADDLAYYIQALINMQEVSGNFKYLKQAVLIAEYMVENFSDESNQYFYFSVKGQKDILARKVDQHDGATPSPNSVMAQNLYYLSIVFDKPQWKQRAVEMLFGLEEILEKYPTSFGNWSCFYQSLVYGIPEIVIAGIGAEVEKANMLKYYLPFRVLVSSTEKQDAGILAGKDALASVALFLCKGEACFSPLKTAQELIKLLKNMQ